MRKRALITGPFGKIGEAVIKDLLQYSDFEIIGLSHLTQEKESFWKDYHYNANILDFSELKNVVLDFAPDFIINAAGFTDVDLAEEERAFCWKMNVDLVSRLTRFAAILDSHLVHISSDYIFDGQNGPYDEQALPSPINFYGKSKLASENTLHTVEIRKTIIRTNFLYGTNSLGSSTFINKLLTSLQRNQKIEVVNSLFTNPVLTTDIAYGIRKILESEYTGIVNFAGPDYLSRYQIALKTAEVFGLDSKLILPIEIEEYPLKAIRPIRAGLISSKASRDLKLGFQGLEEGLKEFKSQLKIHEAVNNPKNSLNFN